MAQHTWRLAPPAPALRGALELDSAQRSVTEWGTGPALVLGGPGTGKTSLILESVLDRMAQGVAGSAILVLAHGRDAAAEIRAQFALRVGDGETPRVTTFHSLALDLVVRAADEEAPLRLLSGAEQERAVRDVLDGTIEDPLLRETWPRICTRSSCSLCCSARPWLGR